MLDFILLQKYNLHIRCIYGSLSCKQQEQHVLQREKGQRNGAREMDKKTTGKITLYHGSPEVVEHPAYGAGKTYKDFGQGFYCTENTETAKEWACGMSRNGYANRYELDFSGLKVLNLADMEYSIFNWLAVLIQNRKMDPAAGVFSDAAKWIRDNFMPDLEQYDVITGCRADDACCSFVRYFLGNSISLKQLAMTVNLGSEGEQYCLRSPAAFETLRFAGYEPADSALYYPKRMRRIARAFAGFKQITSIREKDGIYMSTILDEEFVPGDKRLETYLTAFPENGYGPDSDAAADTGCSMTYGAGGGADFCRGAGRLKHAYEEYYLYEAMDALGGAMEYAVHACGLDPDDFLCHFMASGMASRFENGNLSCICGMSGTEIAMEVLRSVGFMRDEKLPPALKVCLYDDVFWSGWILAYYQWETGCSFSDIHRYISMSEIIRMYYPLHEAPESKFVDDVNGIIAVRSSGSRLQAARKRMGYTQKELAGMADVNLRTLQQYELKEKDINKAAVCTVMNLARVLCCRVEDILEYTCTAS